MIIRKPRYVPRVYPSYPSGLICVRERVIGPLSIAETRESIRDVRFSASFRRSGNETYETDGALPHCQRAVSRASVTNGFMVAKFPRPDMSRLRTISETILALERRVKSWLWARYGPGRSSYALPQQRQTTPAFGQWVTHSTVPRSPPFFLNYGLPVPFAPF